MTARVLAALLLAALGGCASGSRPPVLPQPISLVAIDSFPLYAVGADARPTGSACSVRRVEATIASVRGDTMFLNDVRVVRQPARATACKDVISAMILPARDTSVHAELRRFSSGRSVVALLVLAPITATLILFHLLNGAGS